MRCFIGWVIGASLAASIWGCGPGKELPDDVPHVKDSGTIPPDPGGKVPVTADPAARAIVDKAIKSITQGQPELLKKSRLCRAIANGSFQLLNNPNMSESLRTVDTVWPDRARVVYEFKEGAFLKMIWGLNSQFGWTEVNIKPYEPPTNPTEIAQVIKTDLMAQHWLMLGVGLADSGAIFFDLRQEKTGKSTFNKIKIGIPDRPVYDISFDDKTGLPARIEYAPLEIGQRMRVRKIVTVSEHLAAGGLMLPATMEMTQNEKLAERWTFKSWEFPDKLDDALFNPPKTTP